MIKNILQHKNPQANFSKLINPQKETVISNPVEIHNTIENYYKDLYKQNNLPTIPPEWQEIYKPILTIKDEYYNDLLSEITTSEIQETINQSSNNKAPGPSNITFDIIKKITNPNTLNFLKSLFNKILLEQTLPNQWK